MRWPAGPGRGGGTWACRRGTCWSATSTRCRAGAGRCVVSGIPYIHVINAIISSDSYIVHWNILLYFAKCIEIKCCVNHLLPERDVHLTPGAPARAGPGAGPGRCRHGAERRGIDFSIDLCRISARVRVSSSSVSLHCPCLFSVRIFSLSCESVVSAQSDALRREPSGEYVFLTTGQRL